MTRHIPRDSGPRPEDLPPPVFIITSPRSYSSLICGMLGRHPQLFGLPEVNLGAADRMNALLGLLQAVRPASLHGIWRTVAQLEFGAQTDETIAEAKLWVDHHRDWTTAQLFRHFASRVAPRALVEKSPMNLAFPKNLERLIAAFPEARFLHLTRHPRPTCKSIHALVQSTDAKRGTNRADQTDAERLWQKMTANAMNFLAALPAGQGMRIKGEDLLTRPEVYFPQICEWLGIGCDSDALEEMYHPERSPFACIGPETARFGNDPNYLKNPEFVKRPIAPSTMDGPLDWTENGSQGFSLMTRNMACALGYT